MSKADFVFQADGGPPDKLLVAAFEGDEAISRPFRFEIELVSNDGAIDLNSLIGKPGLLTIGEAAGIRHVHGVILRFKQLSRDKGFAAYEVVLVPSLWLLSFTARSRIFQNMSVVEIIEQALKEGGLSGNDYELSVDTGGYAKREYCVQYRESDLNFISRLMEEEGIFYFFVHSDSGHKMVIADANSATGPVSGASEVPFRDPTAMDTETEAIYRFRFSQEVRTGKVSLQDYNYLKASVNLMATQQASAEADYEMYDYPGEYLQPPEGKRLAKIRLEEGRATRGLGSGDSICGRFTPGHRVKMKEHGRSDFNKEYLLTRVRHTGIQPQVHESVAAAGAGGAGKEPKYENLFECILSDVPYRPERLTPRPVVQGTQTALVVGPKDEKLYMDDKGRAKVLFYWDREGKEAKDKDKGETCSCWVRVSQGYAGPTHGIQFMPLVGDEVVVDFLEGDPDRPLIVGCVYNSMSPPPLKPDDRIQNIILTPYQHRLLFDDKTAGITLNTKEAQIVFLQDASDDNKDFGNTVKISTKDGHYLQLAKGDKHKGLMVQTEAKHKIEMRDDPDPGIFIVDKDEKIYLHLDTQNKTINLINKAETAINIEVPKGKVTVKAAEILLDAENKVEVKAGQEISLSAPDVKVEGKNSVEIKGTQTKIEGSAQMEMKGAQMKLEGSVQLEAKGAIAKFEGSGMVEIKAGGILTIQGSLVKIN